MQEELIETVRCAVTLPLRIEIKDVFDQTSTELLVTAFLDSGGRGRPRVTYDVTTALNQLGTTSSMASLSHMTSLPKDFHMTFMIPEAFYACVREICSKQI